MEIWSSSDYPYQCLLDYERTTTLQAAIQATVRPGDIVVDAGAGTGILSFFAARAGARKVYAVEVDPFVAECLERSVRANNLTDVIEVICDDARCAKLPRDVDIFICELIETGLIEEMQAETITSMQERHVISQQTRMIPFQYETSVELGYTNFNYYGFTILTPKHDWPHFHSDRRWVQTSFRPCTGRNLLSTVDFREPIVRDVTKNLSIEIMEDGLINAVRVSSQAHLAKGVVLGATVALNGDKILPLADHLVQAGQTLSSRTTYQMGAGLSSLQIELLGLLDVAQV